MKKLFILVILVLTMTLTACTTTYQEAVEKDNEKLKGFGGGYFTVVTEWSDTSYYYSIVYANDTKVKYLIMSSGHRCGLTPLYNSDGTLQIYDEDENKQ